MATVPTARRLYEAKGLLCWVVELPKSDSRGVRNCFLVHGVQQTAQGVRHCMIGQIIFFELC